MSSRVAIQQFVSNTEPIGAALGDEWYVANTGLLYKRTAINGTQVGWVNIAVIPSGGTTGQVLTYGTSGTLIWTTSTSGGVGLISPYAGIFTITNTTSAISTITGALQVIGGVGVGGAAYFGGLVSAGNNSVNYLQLVGANAGAPTIIRTQGTDANIQLNLQTTGFGSVVIANSSATTNTGTGALVVQGGVGIAGGAYIGGNVGIGTQGNTAASVLTVGPTNGNSGKLLTVSDHTNPTTQAGANGILVDIAGGGGIYMTQGTGGVYAKYEAYGNALGIGTMSAHPVYLQAGSANALYINTNQVVTISSNTNASGTQSGALVVVGGMGVGKDLYVGGAAYITGDLYVDGSQTFLNSTNIQTGDKVLYLSTGSASINLAVNAGIAIGTTATPYISWLFDGISNWKSSGGIISNNTSTVLSTATAFSTTTGALIVAGGAGFGGNLYATAIYDNNSRVLTTASLATYGVVSITGGTDTSVSTATGSVTIWDTSTLQSVTNRGATSNNAVTLNNGLTLGSTAQYPLQLTGSYSNSLGMALNATGVSAPPATSTTGYWFDSQFTLLPSTSTFNTYYGILFLPTLGNTSTYQNIYGNFSRLDTNINATGTSYVNTYVSFISAGGSKAAGSTTTLTNWYGFVSQDPTALTVTNTYGYSSQISSAVGQNKWNIYSSGSAPNLFQGQIQYNTTASFAGTGGNGAVTAVLTKGADGNFQLTAQNGPVANTVGSETARFGINYAGSGWDTYFQFNRGTVAQNGAIVINGANGISVAFNQPNTQATSTSTGTLVVAGGAGIAGNIYAGGLVYSQGWQLSTSSSVGGISSPYSGIFTITNTTSAISTITGALVVAGGVGIGGSLFVGGTGYFTGDLYVDGTQFIVDTTSIRTADKTLILSSSTTNPGTAINSGIAIGTSTPFITWFYDGINNWKSSGGIISNNTVTVLSTVSAVSSTTGALQVAGGVGIQGDLYARNLYSNGVLIGTNSNSANTATNLANGTTGQVPFQTAIGLTSFFGPGTAGQILLSAGASATGPVYTNTSSIMVNAASYAGTSTNIANGTAGQLVVQTGTSQTGFANTATFLVGYSNTSTNIAGGSTGAILYQSTGGATTNLGLGGNGYVLTAGATAPQWTPVTAIYAGNAAYANTATNINGGIYGQIPYQTGTAATAFFGPGQAGSIVISNGGGSNPPSFTTTNTVYVGFAVTATNIMGGTAGQLNYQSGPGVTAFAGPGTAGQILLSSGAAAPTYVSTANVYVGQALQTNNIIGGAAGSMPYQTAASATTFLALGSLGYVLTAGASAPQWTAIGSLSAGVATTATNLANGTTGQIPYQTSTGITSFFGPGSSGQLLISNGASVPGFYNTGSIHVGAAQIAQTATFATTSTNIAGGSAGAIVYQTAGGQTQFIANSVTYAGYVLQSNGSTATWQPVSSLSAGTSTYAVNVGITDDVATATPQYITFVSVSSGYTPVKTSASKLSYVASTGVLAAPNLFLTSSAASTATTSSNALYVAGGAYINSLFVKNDAVFAGNVTFNGTATYIYSTNTVYTDNIIELHTPPGGVAANWTVDDGKDIGVRFHYYTNSTDTNAALVLANDTKFLEWYSTGAETTGSSIISSATYGTFKTGSIRLADTVNATSTNTGALQLQGGAGIARDLFVGGNITVQGSINATINGVVTSSTQIQITNDLASSTPQFLVFTAGSSGYNALKTAANTGMTYIPSSGYHGININTPTATLHVNGSHIITGVTTVTNTTQSISTNSGALQVAGGAGVGGNLFATALFDNGNRVVTSVTPTAGTAIGISSLISTGTNASFIINNLGVTSAIGTTYLGVSASTGSVTFTNLGVQTLTAGTDTAVSASTGTITIWDTSTLQSVTGRGNTTNNQVIITNATAATTTTNGALQVTGGVGIQGNLYVGGSIIGNFIGSVTTSSNIAVVNNTSSAVAQYITFASTSTGFVQLNTDATSGLTFVPSTWSLGVGVVATASIVKVDVNGEIRTGGLGFGISNTAANSGYWWNINGTRYDGMWYDSTNNRLTFRRNNTDMVIMDSNYNVGIGTTAVDNAANYRTLSIGGTTGGQITWQNGTTYKGFSYNDGTNMIHGAVNNLLLMAGGTTEGARLDSSRNFMVGTSSAVGKVTVQGGSLTVASSTGYALSVGNANSNDLTIGSDASYNYIQTWNTKPLQINNQGNNIYLAGNVSANVGIGQLTAGVKLDVGGSIRATQSVTIGSGGNYQAGSIYADANWGMLFRSATSAPAQATFAWHNFADTEYMRLDAVGNLGLGTTTPTATFQNTGGEKIAGVFTSSNITNTLNTTSGAINTLGGVGIAQDLRVGGTIYGNNIIGNISGVASTSTNATNVNITNDTASATAQYVTFVAASSGYTPVKTAAATGLVYIPSTNSFGIGTATPAYNLQVNGSFAAVTKSFVIDHPTKSGMKLRHGSLEGPENGVYVRGRLTDNNVIELPDYWTGLVDENSITVDLTPIGKHQKLFVQKIENNQVYVGNDGMFSNSINCFYTVWAERKDVDKLVVEIE